MSSVHRQLRVPGQPQAPGQGLLRARQGPRSPPRETPPDPGLSGAPPKFLGASRPRRAGAVSPHGILRFRGDPERGAEAGVASCARSVSSPARRCGGPSRYALPRVLVGSLAPAVDDAKYAADLGVVTLAYLGAGALLAGLVLAAFSALLSFWAGWTE